MTSYVKIKRSKHKPIIIECRSFYFLCPNVAGFLKNVLKRQKKAHLKKEIEGRAFLGGSDEKLCRIWLGRENDVARTPPLLEIL